VVDGLDEQPQLIVILLRTPGAREGLV